jgi:hypothetical protein
VSRAHARALPLVLLAGCALAALAGCGLGAGRTPGAVQLLVTRDFGHTLLLSSSSPKLRGQETVMSALRRNAPVTTRFGGGFVQSIAGLAGGQEGGQPVDWFYYVNGVEAPKGSAETNVHPGDRVWWDLHDWSQTEHIPAVVGSFPEPFRDGLDGKRLPVRVECASAEEAACRAVSGRLRASGAPAAISALSSGFGPQTLRVRVGLWPAVGADPVAQAIAAGPRTSGVYARLSTDGSALTLLGRDGGAARTLGAGAGLVAATRQGEDAPVWVVTGTDDVGLARAAAAFNAAALAARFAVAATATGVVPLPAG